MPVFGGWLRNVEDEGMPATFDYQRDLAVRADHAGWAVTLVAELNLNDIKGPEADCLEAWTMAAALAPLTPRLELMTAVRPNFRLPALVANAGGESPAAKDLIARECDAYLMHGDPPEVLAAKVADMRERRAAHAGLLPLRFGVAAYAIVRPSDAEVKKELARITDVRASARG